MKEDIKKLCIAVGVSVDMIAKKYNVKQDDVLFWSYLFRPYNEYRRR